MLKKTAAVRNQDTISISGVIGRCGSRDVFLGFASASLLHCLSFADTLDEESGKGYQRRFNEKHSLDFRRYIRAKGSTTIPLTFNLRPGKPGAWRLDRHSDGRATLHLKETAGGVLSQVDCQHRLGHLADVGVPLAFMTFIGLTQREEMRIFNVINGKAKGLSTSLIDFHETRLLEDLGKERPELLIAIRLNDDEHSPWYKQLDLGGNRTSGMTRRASLRTMQKAVKRFLKATNILQHQSVDQAYEVARDFWSAIALVLEHEWSNPRKHFLTKGIGVYSLMSLAGDLYGEARIRSIPIAKSYFASALADFAHRFDWSNNGPLKGLGGETGANEALDMLRKVRKQKNLKVI
jgi:DGQHR domain-containing protein